MQATRLCWLAMTFSGSKYIMPIAQHSYGFGAGSSCPRQLFGMMKKLGQILSLCIPLPLNLLEPCPKGRNSLSFLPFLVCYFNAARACVASGLVSKDATCGSSINRPTSLGGRQPASLQRYQKLNVWIARDVYQRPVSKHRRLHLSMLPCLFRLFLSCNGFCGFIIEGRS